MRDLAERTSYTKDLIGAIVGPGDDGYWAETVHYHVHGHCVHGE